MLAVVFRDLGIFLAGVVATTFGVNRDDLVMTRLDSLHHC